MNDSTISVDNETVVGTESDDLIVTGTGNDIVDAAGGDDEVRVGAGDDVVRGGDGADHLVGDDAAAIVFKTDLLTMAEDRILTLTFDFEEAGYRNTIGIYKVDAATGRFEDVEVVWANASLENSGGDLVSGVSDLVPSLPGCGEEPIDVRLAEVVPTALVGVCGSVVAILATPLVDHGSVAPRFGRRPNHERGGYDASEAKLWKWLQGFALRDGAPCGAMPSYVVRKRRSGSPSAGRDRAEEPLIERLV